MEVRLVSQTKIDEDYLHYLMKEAGDDLKFIQGIQDLEGLIAYIARVSSSKQKNPSYAGLIKYCMSHGHWSILEMGNVCFEVKTSRMIAPQILRHRSFNFQEFSQRYSVVDESGIEIYDARRQDKKNRQNSIDDMDEETKKEWIERQKISWDRSYDDYKWALDKGIAKECARAVLPLQAKTRLFMNGTLRSWVHYIKQRSDPATQKEHRDIANLAKAHFLSKFPVISEAAGWTRGSVKGG
jgi:thymidylate synthase (FAD)